MGSMQEFKVGDKVLLKIENRTKDDSRYEGPYTVIERLHERSYQLKDEKGKSITLNVEWMKIFKELGY